MLCKKLDTQCQKAFKEGYVGFSLCTFHSQPSPNANREYKKDSKFINEGHRPILCLFFAFPAQPNTSNSSQNFYSHFSPTLPTPTLSHSPQIKKTKTKIKKCLVASYNIQPSSSSLVSVCFTSPLLLRTQPKANQAFNNDGFIILGSVSEQTIRITQSHRKRRGLQNLRKVQAQVGDGQRLQTFVVRAWSISSSWAHFFHPFTSRMMFLTSQLISRLIALHFHPFLFCLIDLRLTTQVLEVLPNTSIKLMPFNKVLHKYKTTPSTVRTSLFFWFHYTIWRIKKIN